MPEFVPDNAAIRFEIPVSDYERARKFYGAVLANSLQDRRDGPNPMAVFVAKDQSAVAGHHYPGTRPSRRAPGSLSTLRSTISSWGWSG